MIPPQSTRGRLPTNRYRLPGIEREGIAQLSLLETALWPLQGGRLPTHTFNTTFAYMAGNRKHNASVTVRAPLGLYTFDELVLWGLLGASLARPDAEPTLMATPYWMMKHLGLGTGGSQYTELRESLLRLATTSYQNTAFYNPESEEREYAAFQFLSIFLPTVGGVGKSVDTNRCWHIEWNPAFFRFCRATGGNLLFDLDLYRALTPASRRLFLKLTDRFWRSKRVFLNVDDLTKNGLGFSSGRPLFKRKFDLMCSIRELLDRVITLGRGQHDVQDLLIKHGKGSYVVVFYKGSYFDSPHAERTTRQKNAILDDPLYEPLRRLGVDAAGIRRLLKQYSRNIVQRWIRITDAAMHEKPRGFPGFRSSAAAYLIDGVQHNRLPPDWLYAHEKRQEQRRWEEDNSEATLDEQSLRAQYVQERQAALSAYLVSPEGREHYNTSLQPLLAFYKLAEPERYHDAAHEAAIARIEKLHFQFPEYALWSMGRRPKLTERNS